MKYILSVKASSCLPMAVLFKYTTLQLGWGARATTARYAPAYSTILFAHTERVNCVQLILLVHSVRCILNCEVCLHLFIFINLLYCALWSIFVCALCYCVHYMFWGFLPNVKRSAIGY